MPMCLVWRLLDEFRQCAEEKGCDDDPPRDGSWRVKTASRPGSVCPWQLPIYLKYFEHFWTEKMFKRQQKSEGELLGELKWSSYMQISGTSPPHSPRRCGKGVILSESVRLVFSGLGRSRCLNPQVMLSTQPPFFLPATGAFSPSTMPPHTISWWLLHHVCVCAAHVQVYMKV